MSVKVTINHLPLIQTLYTADLHTYNTPQASPATKWNPNSFPEFMSNVFRAVRWCWWHAVWWHDVLLPLKPCSSHAGTQTGGTFLGHFRRLRHVRLKQGTEGGDLTRDAVLISRLFDRAEKTGCIHIAGVPGTGGRLHTCTNISFPRGKTSYISTSCYPGYCGSI